MVQLETVCDVRDGTHDSPKYIEVGYPLITSKNLSNGIIDFDNVRYISEEDYIKINQRSYVDNGDILMPMIGTIGNPIIVDKTREFAIKNVALIKFNSGKVINRYINYCLKCNLFIEYIEKENRGGTQKFLSLNNIRKFYIPLPPLDIQKHIADTLDKTQEIIDGHKKQLKELDNLIKANFYDMFGDPYDNLGNWNIYTLQEMLDNRYILEHLDGNHGSLYPRSEEYVDSGVEYIGANCIIDGTVNFNNAKYISISRAQQFKKGVAKDGDVLFAHNATVGPVAVLHTSNEYVILSTSLTYYRCNNKLINNKYLMYFMQTDFFKNQYTKNMGQTTRNQVPITVQRRLKHMIPPIVLQTRFATIVTNIEQQKAIVKQSIKEAENLFNSLMSKYFD